MSRLEVHGISKAFSGVKAVQNVTLKVDAGEIVSMIGPNGAGKTTIFNLITGIYPLDEGEVLLEGKKISGKPQHVISNLGIGRTFQNIRLFQGMSVLENVITAYDPRVHYNLLDSMLHTPKRRKADAQAKEFAMECLRTVGIAEYANENPSNLPYGLQRKLEIARALATKPKVLLLDEPGAGLNPAEIEELIALIRHLHDTLDLAILIIDHRMKLIMDLSRYIYVLNFGQLLAEGTPAEIQANDEVTKAYIGEEE